MKFIVSAADPLGDLLWFTWALLSPNFDLCESVCESIEFAVCVCVNFKLFDQFDDPLMMESNGSSSRSVCECCQECVNPQ